MALLDLDDPFTCVLYTSPTPQGGSGFRLSWNPGTAGGVTRSERESVEGRPLDERELIASAKNGDTRAFEKLVHIHQGIALRVAYLVLRDPDVVAHWHVRAADAPQNPAEVVSQVLRAGRARVRFDREPLRDSAGGILERLTDRQAVFTERDLLVEVAASFPKGATSAELSAATREVLRTGMASGELVPLPGNRPDHRWSLPGETRFSTRTQLEREHCVLATVHEASSVKVDLQRVELAAKVES
ncbi:MAG: hypothetical protein ACREMZ_16320 [Gemmatimonadales bacterium]